MQNFLVIFLKTYLNLNIPSENILWRNLYTHTHVCTDSVTVIESEINQPSWNSGRANSLGKSMNPFPTRYKLNSQEEWALLR